MIDIMLKSMVLLSICLSMRSPFFLKALIFMVDDQRAIDGIIAGEMGNRSIAGSDDHLIKQLGRYADDGFDETIVPDFALGDTAEARLDAYRRFNDDIASQL